MVTAEQLKNYKLYKKIVVMRDNHKELEKFKDKYKFDTFEDAIMFCLKIAKEKYAD